MNLKKELKRVWRIDKESDKFKLEFANLVDYVQEIVVRVGTEKKAGHMPSAISCIPVLLRSYMETDMVILSKGHGALAQYVILNELERLPDDLLASYGQDGGLSEHSTLMQEYGVYASTGSLGHGIAIGLGYAIANPRKLVTVIVGDGEMDEGSTMEAYKVMIDLGILNCSVTIDRNGTSGFRFVPQTYFGIQKGMYTLRPGEYHNIAGKGWGKDQGTIAGHYQKP